MSTKVIHQHLSTPDGCRPNCPACAAELFECQDCGQRWQEGELKEIQDFHQRVAPGELCPAGECPDPDCGALCHKVEPEPTDTKPTPPLSEVAKRLADGLKELGFGTDNDVSGPDLVDLMSSVFPDLVKAVAKRPHAIVFVEGGVVQNVVCNQEIDCTLIDYDVEGIDPDRLIQIPQYEDTTGAEMNGETEDAFVNPDFPVDTDGGPWLQQILRIIEEHRKAIENANEKHQ